MINTEELRKFAVKDQNISGTAFDDYVHHVESMTRSVIEERPTRFAEIDVFSRLIMDRIIFLGLPVDDNISNDSKTKVDKYSTDQDNSIMVYGTEGAKVINPGKPITKKFDDGSIVIY